MSKKAIRLITLILAVAMVASLAVGCGGDPAGSSSGGSSSDAPVTADGKIPGMLEEVKLEDYQGTTVKYASWKNPWENEDGAAIDKFMEEYGIKVEWVRTTEGASAYVQDINASIASNTQADVFFQSNHFPGSLTAMQPLDAAKLDLTDPIWNQNVIKASTFGGHPYLVDAIANVWSEVDICVYNKRIFENNGITSPAEYYEQGKWTFANFRKAAMEVKALGKDYTGATALGEPILGAAGAAFFTLKDGKFSVTADQHLYDVMTFVTKMREDGYLKRGREEFADGKTGMAITNCFALKKTGYFQGINADDVAATYLPVWEEGDEHQVSALFRGWGLIDGAKNPVAAGIFLRQYLDVNNYDLEQTFWNQNVANFFFEVTGTYNDNVIYNHVPDLVGATGLGDSAMMDYFQYKSSSQIKGYLDSQKNVMDQMVEKANEIIDNEVKWIKQQEADGKLAKLSE